MDTNAQHVVVFRPLQLTGNRRQQQYAATNSGHRLPASSAAGLPAGLLTDLMVGPILRSIEANLPAVGNLPAPGQ